MGCLILLYQGKGRAHMGPGPYDQDRTRLMVSAPGHWEAINLVTRLICPPGSSINLVLGPGLLGLFNSTIAQQGSVDLELRVIMKQTHRRPHGVRGYF